MRSKITLLIALAFIAFATTQCKKKTADEPAVEDPAPPAASGANSVADIIAANGSPAATVSVSATMPSTITINGNIIEIPANAFFNASTSSVATGTVSLTVKTIMTKSQVIFSGAGANSSNSKLVVTKGCVKATASQNTQSLRLNTGGGFFINVPDASPTPPPQKKYYAPKVTATDSTAYWALGTDVADITTRTFSTATVYHHASLDSLKWLNVGTQFDSVGAPKIALTVSVTSSMFSKANTMIFLSKNGSLTVGALFEISPGIFRISNMPKGMAANIVAIAVVNGQYYTSIVPITIPDPSANPTINLTMTAVSQSQMQTQVAALP